MSEIHELGANPRRRLLGERDGGFELWTAARVFARNRNEPVLDWIPKLAADLDYAGKSIKTIIKTAEGLERKHEAILAQETCIRQLPNGFANPSALQCLLPMRVRKNPPTASVESPPAVTAAPVAVAPVAAAPVAAVPARLPEEDPLDGLLSEDDIFALLEVTASDQDKKLWKELEYYREHVKQTARLPIVPHACPSLGVIFFATARFTFADGAVWNYNGKNANTDVMFKEQPDVLVTGVPLKTEPEPFEDWVSLPQYAPLLNKEKCSGTFRIYAAKFVPGVVFHLWYHGAPKTDVLKFDHTLDATGFQRQLKKESPLGSGKYVNVGHSLHFGPTDLDYLRK